ARKGNAKYRITFHGKASHAGSALTEGVSAITELAHWVLAINEQVNMTTGTTMNVGVVQGGTGVNVVPDFAEAIVDLRFWSNEEAAAVHERLTFMANNPFLAGCRVEVDRQTFKPAMRPSGDTEALMALVEEAAKEEGIPFNWLEAGGGSDANFTAAAGVPSLDGFGPMGGGFHSEAEFLLLESIEPRIRLLQRVLGKLAK
ncbi:MAG: M20/M25/M40 family metallo-hydrolase, partial [Aeromonas veronii]